jgi:exopolysaccharide production protein ExoQ
MLLLVYFALDGVSPFANNPVAMRTVATVSAGGIVVDRVTKLLVFLACMLFVVKRQSAVRRLSMQMKLVTAFPILALLLCPLSQQPSRTISSGVLLLGSTLLLYYIMTRYSSGQVLEILLVLGTMTILGSIMFSLATPQYGLDQMGGHSDAWKGLFSAKNYFGNMALFFMTAAVSYRPRTMSFRVMRGLQIIFCLVAIAFSRAATAYLLTVIYVAYFVILKALHRLRKTDYLLVCLLLLVAVSTVVVVIVVWPDSLIYLLGKDVTLTGRTQIWSAVFDSIVKRPWLGYGYQAFWLGLEGESYRVILVVSWLLSQAQNGFLDVLLESGLMGLTIVLLVFGFALRDGVGCLLRSRDETQLRAVEWYLALVLLTFIYNLDESFLFDPKHFGSMMFLLAVTGLKMEWMRVRSR